MDETAAALLITADDYGYAPSYDEGILEAATEGAIDGAGVMVLRRPAPDPLAATGVAIGLHLEPAERAPFAEQLSAFEALFGHEPRFIDGHKHCHAAPGGPALAVAKLARARGIRVRSVSARHRRLLRCQGVPTPDRLVGRLREEDPAMPEAIEAWLAGRPPAGTTEWMTHPGHADPAGRSSYDRGREEDLALLLRLAGEPALAAARRPPF